MFRLLINMELRTWWFRSLIILEHPLLRGPGGLRPGEGRNRVFYCFWQRGVSATRCFLSHQNNIVFCPRQSYRFLKPWKYGQLQCARELKTRFPKNGHFQNLKIYLFLHNSFWNKCLKLGSYVMGKKTQLLIEQIFDLGLRSENIEFWKFPMAKKLYKFATGKL